MTYKSNLQNLDPAGCTVFALPAAILVHVHGQVNLIRLGGLISPLLMHTVSLDVIEKIYRSLKSYA